MVCFCTMLHAKKYYFYLLFSHFYFPASGQAVVTGVIRSSPRFLPSIFFAHRVQAIPLLVDCSSSVANSRSRVFRKSICAQILYAPLGIHMSSPLLNVLLLLIVVIPICVPGPNPTRNVSPNLARKSPKIHHRGWGQGL